MLSSRRGKPNHSWRTVRALDLRASPHGPNGRVAADAVLLAQALLLLAVDGCHLDHAVQRLRQLAPLGRQLPAVTAADVQGCTQTGHGEHQSQCCSKASRRLTASRIRTTRACRLG